MPLTRRLHNQRRLGAVRAGRYAAKRWTGSGLGDDAHRCGILALSISAHGQDREGIPRTLSRIVSLKEATQKRDALAADAFRGHLPCTAEAARKSGDGELRRTVARIQRALLRGGDCEGPERCQPRLRRYLEKEIYPAFGNRPIREITAQDVQRLVFRKRDNGFESAAAQLRNLLKRVFDYALVCGVVTANPTYATPTRFITRARPRTRSLSPDELRTYLQVLYRSNIRRQFKLALNIILLTLVRKSELLHARWEHIDHRTGEWLIPEATRRRESLTSSSHVRQVADMFEELRVLAGDSELVLPGRGSLTKPFAANALNKALEGVNFPIPPFTIHDLRRTGSTILHEQGFPSDVVEKALNHSIGGIRGVYNRG